VTGDITLEGLGIEARRARELRRSLTQAWHLAAVYDLAVARDVGRRINVEGTKNVLEIVSHAPPIERLPAEFVAPACPWLVIHGRADEVVPVDPVILWAGRLARPPRLVLPEGVGHFFHGRLALLTEAVDAAFGADLRATGG
jgi:pimeloyl-ACP methyl ester carboxylesterase